jgi:uncharacterized membrane protein
MPLLLNASLIDFIQLVLALIIFYLCYTFLSTYRKRARKPINRGKPIGVSRSAPQ